MIFYFAKSFQSRPTLCDPIDSSPPGFPIPGILQARTLEWVAISFSNAWKWKAKVKSLSRVWRSATLWTAAFQAPPSMGFSRQEYGSGVPLPSPIFYFKKTKSPTGYRNESSAHGYSYSESCRVSQTELSGPIFTFILSSFRRII